MKKYLIISFCIVLIISSLLFTQYEFDSISRSRKPYLSNKQQFMGVFYTNFDLFELIAKEFGNGDKNLRFQYNPNLDDKQIYSEFGDGELSEAIMSLIHNAGMTDFWNYDGYFAIYQYAPVSGSHIYIGARYDYVKQIWEYYYYHDYSWCSNDKHNKYIYWIYDCLFNRKEFL